jgi:chemotaxis protein MotA
MLVCVVAVVAGILSLGGDIMSFLNLPSVLLVLVPTLGSLVSTYPIELITKIPAHFKVILGNSYKPEEYIEQILDFSRISRKEGLLALENEKIDEPIMQYAVRLIVDGVSDERTKHSLEAHLDGISTRHAEVAGIYEKAAAYAPAFGMCATVVSLVNMLMGLDFSDPNAINNLGVNMSAALITTFYGSLFANIVFLPIAARLKLFHKREIFCKTMICDGILAILRGENTNLIAEFLYEQLDKSARGKAKSKGGEEGGDKSEGAA